MSHDSEPRPAIRSRLQFSLFSQLSAVFVVAMVCAAVRWLGLVAIVPAVVFVACVACTTYAVKRRVSWRMLRAGWWHAAIWLLLGAVASTFAIQVCRNYNEVAGTDKTEDHIAWISVMTLAGPLVGPVANPGGGEAVSSKIRRAAVFLLVVQFLAIAPALFVRRVVAWPVALVCWLLFVGATLLWFFAAMISLGVFLS